MTKRSPITFGVQLCLGAWLVLISTASAELNFTGTAGDIRPEVTSLQGDWEETSAVVFEDVSDPPPIEEQSEEADFARQMMRMSLPMLERNGVTSAANYMYEKKDNERSHIMDVNVMVFEDTEGPRKLVESKLRGKFKDANEPYEVAGATGYRLYGDTLTYTYLHRGNVYISVKSFSNSPANDQIAGALASTIQAN